MEVLGSLLHTKHDLSLCTQVFMMILVLRNLHSLLKGNMSMISMSEYFHPDVMSPRRPDCKTGSTFLYFSFLRCALYLIDLIIILHRYDIYEEIKEGMSWTGYSKCDVNRAAGN